MTKFYAVRKGHNPGIYATWPECQKQIAGFSGNEYKKFEDEDEFVAFSKAMEYLDEGDNLQEKVRPILKQAKMSIAALESIYIAPDTAIAFTDGSFNKETNIYGCGVIVIFGGKAHETYASGDDDSILSMNNVAGEILGAQTAMKMCVENGINKLILCYDYEGIEKWCTGSYEATKKGTQAYRDYYNSIKDKLDVTFVYVKSHIGIELNEHVDRLAKKSVGIS